MYRTRVPSTSTYVLLLALWARLALPAFPALASGTLLVAGRANVNEFFIKLPVCFVDRLQLYLNARPRRVDSLHDMYIHNPIVVYAQGLAERVLGYFQTAVEVALEGGWEVKVDK